MKRIVLIFFTFLALSFGISWVVVMHRKVAFEPGNRMVEILKPGSVGFEVTDLPLGDTELLVETTENAMQFDESIYREYRLGRDSITLLLFRWYPGSASLARLAGHTPDTCWVSSGWVCRAEDRVEDARITTDVLEWFPVQQRLMRNRNESLYVNFFYVMDGEIQDHSKTYIRDGLNTLLSPFRFGFSINKEKFYIRFTSEHPFESWMEHPEFRDLLGKIHEMTMGE